jgi:serine/threonine protein kinase
MLSPGTILNERYIVQNLIAQGGTSNIYKALDLRRDARPVAIKELTYHLEHAEKRDLMVGCFWQGIDLMRGLRHLCIPRVWDIFTVAERPCAVVDYVPGRNMEQYLTRSEGLIHPKLALRWAILLCDVLEYLHTRRIVFCDLKPNNILLDGNLTPYLADFSIARPYKPGQAGPKIGTAGYAAPEQYEGFATPQSDQYTLGATLHHVLTRTDPRQLPPFSFSERPIRHYNPEVSGAFEAIIMRALAPDAQERYQHLTDMKRDLEAIIE